MKSRSWTTGITIMMVLIMVLIMLLSCGSTKLIQPWRDPAYEGKYLKNVLVVGLSDPFERRKLFEDTFVANLQRHGVNAVALSSRSEKEKGTAREAKAMAAKQGNDAILAIRLIGISSEEVDMRVVPSPQIEEHSMNDPGPALAMPAMDYETARQRYVMQSTLYNTETGKIIWRSRTETIDPSSISKLVDSMSWAILRDLRRDKLIQ